MTAPPSEVQKVFGASAETYHALKQSLRDAIAAVDLSDEEAEMIAAARIPPEHRHSLGDDV
jgi:hypothetical protein